jgi:hypothetical protein
MMSLAEKVRKADWLNELRALVIAGAVLIPVFTVVEVVEVLRGGQVVAELRANPTGPDTFTISGRAAEHLSTSVAIADPTPAQAWWYLATKLPSTLILVTVLLILLRLLSRARRGNPFNRETVRDLRWAAVVLMAGGSLAGLAEGVATLGLSEGLVDNTVSGYWEVPILWLFSGFAVMAIAQVVARGHAMREELEEVI